MGTGSLAGADAVGAARRGLAVTRPGVRRVLPALALGFACNAHSAPADAMAWLSRAAAAAREATYEGVYVHVNGERISTVRVSHASQGAEEHERIEPLDGGGLEIVRRNEERYCRFPDKTVKLDPRVTNRFFPGILGGSAETIAQSYEVSLGPTERVLGYECQWIRLDPRDELRFAQRVCAESSSGLILRARVLNSQRQAIEQYTFTDLKIGSARSDLRSIFKARSRQWVTDGQPRDETASAETGWAPARLPPGFRKVAELKRTLPGRPSAVAQIVLTDGVASLSLFVEPAPGGRRVETASQEGTTAFYSRPDGDQVVSVLGEVPLATAQLVARSVTRRP
jgi:sigma-E factor negative regulatory protein RseB